MHTGWRCAPWVKDAKFSALVFSTGLTLVFVADRTALWSKEQKQFDPRTFGFLCLISLCIGLLTVRHSDKDLGFLNREQTDEWKGWMQSGFYCIPPSRKSITNATWYSCNFNLSLFRCFKNIGDLQPYPCPRRILLIYDWLWSYDVLSKKRELCLFPNCPGMQLQKTFLCNLNTIHRSSFDSTC